MDNAALPHSRKHTRVFLLGLLLLVASFAVSPIGSAYYKTGEEGGTGGTAFGDDYCPPDANGEYFFLFGLRVRAGTKIDRIQNICKRWAGATDPSDPTQYIYDQDLHGGNGGSTRNIICSDYRVVKGFYGQAGAEIDKLTAQCVSEDLVVNDVSAAEEIADWVDATGYWGGDGGSMMMRRCGIGDAALGIYGRSGQRVDRLGLLCADRPSGY